MAAEHLGVFTSLDADDQGECWTYTEGNVTDVPCTDPIAAAGKIFCEFDVSKVMMGKL